MKKNLFFIVGILMISSIVITGGGCSRKTSAAIPDDPFYPIEISIYIDAAGSPRPAPNNKMYKYIEDNLNVTFSWDILVGDLSQKRGTMVAGGQYPDILQINETFFIDQGAVIPLEDLIEQYGPNIKRHYANVWDQMKSPDGHIYHLIDYGVTHGINQDPFYNGSAFWTQKAVLKDAGYPNIKTVEEWFAMIANYYRRNPTIDGQPAIPFTVITEDWRAFELWNPPNFLSGNPNEGNGIVDPNTLEYKVFFTSDHARRWYRMLNEYDKQGLIDRAGFTDSYDQYQAKIASGRVLGLFGQQWQFDSADKANTDRGQHIRTMAPLPIVFDANITPKYRTDDIPNIGRGLGISVSAKDPVRIIRFINACLEEDVQRTFHWGIEGEDWQRGPDGVPYRTQQQRDNWDTQAWQDANRALLWTNLAPKRQGSFSDGYPFNLQDYYPEREAMMRPEDRELYNAYGVTGYAQMMAKEPLRNTIWYPTWNMPNPPDGSPAQIALQRCEQTMKRMLPQMILAPTAQFDSLWNTYVQEMTVTNNVALYEQYMTEQVKIRVRERGGR